MVSHEGRTLSTTLPADREWLVRSARHAGEAELEAIWLVHLERGAALALLPLDDSGVDRQVGAADSTGAARLGVIARSASVASHSTTQEP